MISKTSKIVKIVALGILLIFVITSPLLIRGYRQMRAFNLAFSRYTDAITQSAYQSAYDMSDPRFKTVTPYLEFENIHQSMLSRYGNIRSAKRGRTRIEGKGDPMDWYAVADAVLQFDRGAMKIRYSFHIADGSWKLYGFEELK
jgi:hypothetical protein